jgi:hypothetical protein
MTHHHHTCASYTDELPCDCDAFDRPAPFWRVLAYGLVLIAVVAALLWAVGLTGGGVYQEMGR